MPTYVYKFVDTGETIEVHQAFTDSSLTEFAHPDTGDVLPVKKVFTPVGVTFKGSGFFKTDNRGKKSAADPASTDSKAGKDSGGDSPTGKNTASGATSDSTSGATSDSKSTSGSSSNSANASTKKDSSPGATQTAKPAAAKPSSPSST